MSAVGLGRTLGGRRTAGERSGSVRDRDVVFDGRVVGFGGAGGRGGRSIGGAGNFQPSVWTRSLQRADPADPGRIVQQPGFADAGDERRLEPRQAGDGRCHADVERRDVGRMTSAPTRLVEPEDGR